MKKINILLISFILIFIIAGTLPVFAEGENTEEVENLNEDAYEEVQDEEFDGLSGKDFFVPEDHENGFKEISSEYEDSYDPDLFSDEENTTPEMFAKFGSPQVGYFTKRENNATVNVYPTATSNSAMTYITADQYYTGMFPVLEQASGRYRIMISGVDGWISQLGVTVQAYRPESTVNVYYRDYGQFYTRIYENSDPSTKNTPGRYFSSRIGLAPSYINHNANYYSFDGHYFYTTFVGMYNDYTSGTRSHAVNANNPYYSYFQFLPYRSSTNISAADLNNFLVSKKPNARTDSAMYNQGQSFINSGSKYGLNATLTYLLGIHESGWGTSYIAKTKNNLFGHAAFDSNPGAAASYKNVGEGIDRHNDKYLNWNFLCVDSVCAYGGGAVGDKRSGLNVRYSSDPYWGVKTAALYYELDDYVGGKDYRKYTLGVTTDSVNLRKDATTNSSVVYQVPFGTPVLIMETVNGQVVSGTNNKWHKIATDAVLGSDRLLHGCSTCSGRGITVNLNQNYSYIYSQYIRTIVESKNGNPVQPDPDPTPPGEDLRGDINGDGKITVIDLAMIKSHLEGVRLLTGEQFERADLNGDGKITVIDLAMIKSHLEGIKPLN